MPLEPRLLVLADKLIDFVLRGSGFQVVVCDETGTIVRATVHSRIGTVHAGAVKIMRGDVDEYAVTKAEAAANPLVREGLNYPIMVHGERVGTFGVAASSSIALPLARVCSLVLSSWLGETPTGPLAPAGGEPSTPEEPWMARRAIQLTRQVSDLQRALRAVEQQLVQATRASREASKMHADASAAVDRAREELSRCADACATPGAERSVIDQPRRASPQSR